MDCFHFLMIRTGMFSDVTSVIGFSIPLCLASNVLVSSSATSDIMLTTVVKTHPATSEQSVSENKNQERNLKHTHTLRHSRSNGAWTKGEPPRTMVLLLLLHGTNNRNNTCYVLHTNMFSFAMQAHYSTASRLAYITQSDQINPKTKQVHVGEATHSARLTLQLLLQLVSRYKRRRTHVHTKEGLW